MLNLIENLTCKFTAVDVIIPSSFWRVQQDLFKDFERRELGSECDSER